jgi:hypothetical protein
LGTNSAEIDALDSGGRLAYDRGEICDVVGVGVVEAAAAFADATVVTLFADDARCPPIAIAVAAAVAVVDDDADAVVVDDDVLAVIVDVDTRYAHASTSL